MAQSQINSQLHLIQTKLCLATFEQQCLRFVSDGDNLLFLNDSVFVLLQKEFNSDAFLRMTRNVALYAIDEQLQARNITRFNSPIKPISFQGFVEKSQNASKVISW